jgi:hypothetical protein
MTPKVTFFNETLTMSFFPLSLVNKIRSRKSRRNCNNFP